MPTVIDVEYSCVLSAQLVENKARSNCNVAYYARICENMVTEQYRALFDANRKIDAIFSGCRNDPSACEAFYITDLNPPTINETELIS